MDGLEKILIGVIVALIIACCVLYWLHSVDVKENAELKTALASQSAILAETELELKKRDTVIKQRDARLAELERKTEQQEGKYARLVRANRVVQEWDAVRIPDDVAGLLKAGAGSADRPAGGTDAGSVSP